jgi:hypothetical protein
VKTDIDPPFVAESETSRAAAESIAYQSPRLRDLVHAQIFRCGLRGATNDELEDAMALRHQTLSARVRELVLLGRVEDSGERRKTRSGRLATVWIAAGWEGGAA